MGGRGCKGMDTGLRTWAATIVRRAGRMTEAAQPHFPHCPDFSLSVKCTVRYMVPSRQQTEYSPSIFYQDERRRTADTVEYL